LPHFEDALAPQSAQLRPGAADALSDGEDEDDEDEDEELPCCCPAISFRKLPGLLLSYYTVSLKIPV